ncbi:MAG: hypothetical protein K0V04_00210, partial [Deltaproteobacteria bacterium]|nr:hypothetical protein [Deltaproteobacteria bacterium]
MSPFDSTTKQPRLPCPTRRPQSRLAAWLASVVLAAGSATASASEPGMWNTVGDGGTPSVMKHLAPTGPALQRPSALGTVGTTGEAGYSAAVELPPSLLGPSLSLRYTAGAGPGFEMGAWGWTLDGVLTLREIDEHYYTHTHPGETWFRLEGGLQGTLIPTGTAGGLEQFVAKSTASDPLRASWDPLADTWQVQTQGVTSVLEHVGFENTYRVTEQFDSWGNRVDYAYTPQGRIASIELGGNGATPHNIRVDFSYVAAAHSSRVYAGGQFSDYDQLLDEVEVSVLDGASWLRAWSYLVVHVDHDDVELVASITKVGHFAADLGPALAHYVGTFEYSALELPDVRATETPTPSLVTAVTTDTYKEGRFDPSPVSKTVVDGMMADLDGDGLTDVIESSGNTGFLPTADGGDQISGSTTVASSDWCVSYMLLDPSPETGARYYYEDECQALTGPMAAVGETVTVLGMAYTVSQLADLDGDGFVDVVTSPGTTDFSVYYGRPWDEAEPNAGPFDVEEVLESSPSWLYSRTAYAPNAMVLPIESRGTTHGLMDLSGDGFLDQVDFGGGVYYPHSGVRGGGWNATAVPMSYPFAALEQFERVRIDDPIEDARNAHDPADWDAYFHVFSHSNLARGVVELTGDGCMDAVDASTTPWQVYP